jgi:hypothetical protein
VAIRIGLLNSAEVYTFPHMIGTVLSVVSRLNISNETLYPNVRDLRCPYSPTTTSQGLKNDVEDHLASTPNNVEDHLASTQNNVEDHLASTPDHLTT